MNPGTQPAEIGPGLWELPVDYKAGMRVPARLVSSEALLEQLDAGVIDQITNVATLPGVTDAVYCMPDGHWGYGFPIGGVAAMDIDRGGVISPGGIGFDINCGMRLVRSDLTLDEIRPRLRRLVDRLFEAVPAGVGSCGLLELDADTFCELLQQGAGWCVRHGYGWAEDLEFTEERGCVAGADPGRISARAVERGRGQIGTLGSGNHYLEIQVVEPQNLRDREAAESLGVGRDHQVVIMFHCGSRGFGHQVATDYLRPFLETMGARHGIQVPDRELAAAPFESTEGRDYFAAMNCAINLSFANRQMILHRIREVFSEVLGRDAQDLGLRQVYDVAHNTAKLEDHVVDGESRHLLVHRKGATRAFGPGHPELPECYRELGQPVIIGGSMETGSYLLLGSEAGAGTFFSTAHGSGRTMSRSQARKRWHGGKLQSSMAQRGIYVRAASKRGLAEEAGGAYKNIDEVVAASEAAGISRPVVRFTPVGNVKG